MLVYNEDMNEESLVYEISRRYTQKAVQKIERAGAGNINDTFFVGTDTGKYVFQRLQKKMDTAKLEYNNALYSEVCEKEKLKYPKWIKTVDGSFFTSDSDGNSWRMYPYIEGDILSVPLSEDQCYACGEGLGRIHTALREMTKAPRPVYPHLHDLLYYYEQYEKTLSEDGLHTENRAPEIEERIRLRMEEYSSFEADDLSVIHGDAKVSNILFREGKVCGFLDWDTVMTGSASEEVADCIRSACVAEGILDIDAAKALIEGYRAGAHANESIVGRIPRAFDKICFELGLRYYTDAISKDKHFKEKYPGYRLKRAKELFYSRWPES